MYKTIEDEALYESKNPGKDRFPFMIGLELSVA